MTGQEDELFKKSLKRSLMFYVVFGLIMSIVKLPALKPPSIEQLSDRVAKLILEPQKKEVPKASPKPTPIKKAAKKKVKAKPAKKGKPKPKAKVKKQIVKKQPIQKKAPPRPTAAQNREIVRKSGLLASFIEEESSGALNSLMADKKLDEALSNINVISAPKTKRNRSVTSAPRTIQKSKVANDRIANLSGLSLGEGIQLAKREVVAVSVEGARGNGGAGGSSRDLGGGIGVKSGSGRGAIDYDAIVKVVEKYKGGLVYLYNKALRSNPTLKGTITVEISIDENGKVIEALIKTSSMDHKKLEKSMSRRIKMWKFPKLSSGVVVVTYPFVFFPV